MVKGLPKRTLIAGVEHVLIIASGKGGVGKSTIAVNLAVTMATMGQRVGLLDGDIFGPSIPLMMNVCKVPQVDERKKILPAIGHGVKCLSMGLFVKRNDAMIWRGPMVMSALQTLIKDTSWGPLDILIIDTPPGTGDVHLSLTQNIQISGVLLVSTPQTAALQVVARGAQMYTKLKVPIVGLVENMSFATCEKCQHRLNLWPNMTEKYSELLNTNIIISMPIENELPMSCDSGVPHVLRFPVSEYSRNHLTLAMQINERLKTRKPVETKS